VGFKHNPIVGVVQGIGAIDDVAVGNGLNE